jgi:hypothetical protein
LYVLSVIAIPGNFTTSHCTIRCPDARDGTCVTEAHSDIVHAIGAVYILHIGEFNISGEYFHAVWI